MMITFTICSGLLLTVCAEIVTAAKSSSYGVDMEKQAKRDGFRLETHPVVTEDGYVLNVHRIPCSRTNCTGKVVMLMHGLLGSSYDYVSAGQKRSLAYLLENFGFDVWMCNQRGNIYSRKHQKLSPDADAKKFWDFSWHEVGYYDMAASIDYILNHTSEQKLHLIGLSQGTTTSFVLLSERPSYNDKIHQLIALAPVGYIGNIRNGMLRMASSFIYDLEMMTNAMQIYEVLPQPLNEILAMSSRIFCRMRGLQDICSMIVFMIGGFDPPQLNGTITPTILANGPGGSSVKQFYHYGQLITSGTFRQYDYRSKSANLKKYHQTTPPAYNLSRITAPVNLMYSDGDLYTSEKDIFRLRDELGNLNTLYKVPLKSFSHIDFYWANDVVKFVYKHVFDLLVPKEERMQLLKLDQVAS